MAAKGEQIAKLQNGLINIEPSSFDECTSLGKISFPETLKKISSGAFIKCSSLTRAEFNGDTEVLPSAFSDCPNLQEVVFYKPVTNIHDMSFSGNPQLTLYSDNDAYVEEYAKKSKLFSENIRTLKPYVDQGIMDPEPVKEKSRFPGSYTFIVVCIIIIDVGLVVLFSFYILFIQPKKKRRAAQKRKAMEYNGTRTVKEKKFRRHEKFVEISPEETIIYAPPRQNTAAEKSTSVHRKNSANTVSGKERRKAPEMNKPSKRPDKNSKKN